MSHTKGPWKISKVAYGRGQFNIRAADGRAHGIAGCGAYEHESPEGSFTQEEMESNARLIAAAPAMFDALKACLKELDAQSEFKTRIGAAALASAALRLAEKGA